MTSSNFLLFSAARANPQGELDLFSHQSVEYSVSTLSTLAEEMIGEVVLSPARKLEDLIRLAELCVDLLRQNEEFYAEVNIIVGRRYFK